MIKIQLVSDLHTDCHADRGAALTKELAKASKSSQVDILALAGDIACSNDLNTLKIIFGRFCDAWPHVLWTPGNHFFYGGSVRRKEEYIVKLKEAFSNFHVLDNSIVEIKGQRWLGGTGWFNKDITTTNYMKNCMGDFSYIGDFEPWVYNKNKAFKKLLKEELKPSDCVMSHHLPSYLAVAPQFKNDQLNRFFVNDMEPLIKECQPKIWLFGHTHVPCQFDIGKTKLYCNPLGYPSENKARFNPSLIIEI